MKKVLVAGVAAVLVITLVAFGINPISEPHPDIQIALYTGTDSACSSRAGVAQSLDRYMDIHVRQVVQSDIVSGALRSCHAIIVTGSSTEELCRSLGRDGCRALERFVSAGGGFIGIGGAAGIPSLGWNNRMKDLELIDARFSSPGNNFERDSMIKCRALTRGGRSPVDFRIKYTTGPVFSPGADPYLQDYVCLAKYMDAEEAKDAIIASRFGRGRIILFSPHPELTEGLDILFAQSIRWAAGQSEPQTMAMGPEFSWEGIFGVAPLTIAD